MAKQRPLSPGVREFALIGARARLEQLRAEADSIVRAFPELGTGRGRKAEPAAAAAAPERRRRPMSAAARRAVSKRMKKYWAERRKSKTAKS